MTNDRILITGASGCLGSYLLEELMNKSRRHLVLLLRDPENIIIPPARREQIEIIRADLNEVEKVFPRLENIGRAVLAATCWGGPDTFAVNVGANSKLSAFLAARNCRRIIYLATASILERTGRLLPAARELGSEYIRSKLSLVESMEALAGKSETEIIGLFPTLVLGGGTDKPYSHFSRLLHQAVRWAWLGRFFRAEGAFHFIHARDIALIVRHMLESEDVSGSLYRRIVLGNPVMTVDDFIREFSAYSGKKILFRLELRTWMAEFLIRIFRLQLSDWDRYCLDNRDLSFPAAINPAAFGLPAHCPDLAAGLASIGIRDGRRSQVRNKA